MKKSLRALAAAAAVWGLAGHAALAAPVTYEIDSSHTFPRFSYRHQGLSTQLSSFRQTTGVVVYDAQAKTASVNVSIDMGSVNSGFAPLDEHLRANDMFDVAQYPTATFRSTRVVFSGDKPVRIQGDLTIKGVTRPVTLEVIDFVAIRHPSKNKPAIGAQAITKIKRSEFNAGTHVPLVGDEVTIDIALEAIAQ
ncbi:MAG: YceI family protein [Burkholderiaceae bacterium]|jgi:polyisoprenoid-binding protein YceI|nr:YceI family protein [Burkholderiaceae bacterium]